jgi:type II secretory pathway component PulM
VAVLVAIIAVLLLAAVVVIVAGPLRRAAPPAADREAELADLETARAAKYREIRDAELDLATGKLSAADHAAIDASLRAEALEILKRIKSARGEAGEAPAGPPSGRR